MDNKACPSLKAAKRSYSSITAMMEQENTGAMNKTDSKAGDYGSPPKVTPRPLHAPEHLVYLPKKS